ncbi:hypothetical protein Thimo_2602 [Thioflavicoccus mobilis 8321]|uniref:Uncharacterized protein n=1 Tax=Thioflavicoccus mobilis 8321 TaxID=765912 RepID=L0GZD7_9GAMM|nr:hypothetical protein [Thioflavicoccus mobilis]AGA91326.1 hypothetical protein Thimo_2602 [Thioflavicoccus mobilis 8321]
MILIGHAVLFLLSGLSGYLMAAERSDTQGFFLLIGSAAAGFFLLGWTALLLVIAGVFIGTRIANRRSA